MKVELVTKTVGVGKYSNLSNEEIIEAVARHGIIKDNVGKLTKYLLDHKHVSPLQHVYFGFYIETTRAIAAQIQRHWSLHLTELDTQEYSLRYSEPTEIEQLELRKEHPTNRQSSTDIFDPILKYGKASDVITTTFNKLENLYHDLIKAGVARECARGVLPLNTQTKMHLSGNLRNWLTFLNLRMEKGTQKEAREIATLVGEALEKELPNVFNSIDWRNGLFL